MAFTYTSVFNTWFLSRPEIADFVGRGGPGGPNNDSRTWGASPPHFLEWFLGPPGPPKLPKSTIPGRPQNHVLKPTCIQLRFTCLIDG